MPGQPARPNILLIHGDQHRFDCLGICGNPDVKTPNLDSLATDGTLYDNSFCPYPVCTPSRYSLLTGQYVHQHLGWSNRSTLPTGIPTFPRILKDSGYRTCAVGKMHFTPTYLDVGFEQMFLAEQDGPGRFDDDYHRWLMQEGLIDRLDLMDQRREYRETAPSTYWRSLGALESDLDEAHHSTTWIADRALEQLERWTEGRNCLMVGFIKPHHPFDPPAPWYGSYDPESLTLLPGWLEHPLERDLKRSEGYFHHADITEEQLRVVMACYYATIAQIDYRVGKMIALLKERGLYDNTMVIYTSDHGEYLGFHHLLLKGNYLYDPLARVPLIVKFPHGAARGKSEVLTNTVDLAPTILSAAGVDTPPVMSGVDLTRAESRRRLVFAESIGWPGHGIEYMARSNHAKLLLSDQDDRSAFFDLEKDPLELENRYTDPSYTGAVSELKEAIVRWLLFESPSRLHCYEDAPVISDEKTRQKSAKAPREIEVYFQKRMTEPSEETFHDS